jgi:hypothetical protein
VRREDDRRSLRHLLDGVDEDGSALLEISNDVRVVDDLLPYVDGLAVEPECALDRVDGPLYAGAVAAGRGQEDTLHQTAGQDSSGPVRLAPTGQMEKPAARGGRRGGLSQVAHHGAVRPGTASAVRIAQRVGR